MTGFRHLVIAGQERVRCWSWMSPVGTGESRNVLRPETRVEEGGFSVPCEGGIGRTVKTGRFRRSRKAGKPVAPTGPAGTGTRPVGSFHSPVPAIGKGAGKPDQVARNSGNRSGPQARDGSRKPEQERA
jgi:hypothetical protein